MMCNCDAQLKRLAILAAGCPEERIGNLSHAPNSGRRGQRSCL
jgi:hypothetical protein